MAISAIHFLHDRIVGDLLTHQNAADLTPQTLAQEQRKHCKCRNSNLRRLQCLRVNTLLQGVWRDAYVGHAWIHMHRAECLWFDGLRHGFSKVECEGFGRRKLQDEVYGASSWRLPATLTRRKSESSVKVRAVQKLSSFV
jgi:hypothetical protein